MKILVNLLTFNNSFTGAGYYVVRLLDVLKDIDTSNQYILLVNKNAKILDYINVVDNNISFCYVNSPTRRVYRVLFEQFILPLKLLRINYDVFFSPNPVLPVLSLKLGKKYICTIHDLTPLIIKKDSFIQKIYYKYMTFLSAKKADKIISVSNNTKKDIVRFFTIKEDKIAVVYNFLDKTFNKTFSPNKHNSNEQYFLYVGNVHIGKNLLNLIKAFSEFKQRTNSEIKLFIIGKDGFGATEIHKQVIKDKLEEEVKFLGFVSDNDIKYYYKNAYALVFPSFYEGFGYPPLEAMYFKVLPIVSNISSIPEVVGNAGLYFDPYSVKSIAAALEKSLYIDRKPYVMNMKKQLDKFNGEKQSAKFVELIDNVVKER